MSHIIGQNVFIQLRFPSFKAVQPLRGMELQGKEKVNKAYRKFV